MVILSGIVTKKKSRPMGSDYQDMTPMHDDDFWAGFKNAVMDSGPSLGVVLSIISPDMFEYYEAGGKAFENKAKAIIKDIHGRVKG